MEKGILQKLKREYNDEFLLAERYYALLSTLNNLKLTTREIQLVAYTAIKGTISYAVMREEFCKKHKTSSPTINNMISKLKKLHILVKDNGKIKVNPILILDFKKTIVLQITLSNGEKD